MTLVLSHIHISATAIFAINNFYSEWRFMSSKITIKCGVNQQVSYFVTLLILYTLDILQYLN